MLLCCFSGKEAAHKKECDLLFTRAVLYRLADARLTQFHGWQIDWEPSGDHHHQHSISQLYFSLFAIPEK